MFLCELGRMVMFAFFNAIDLSVIVEVSREGWRHGCLLEPGRIGRRLTPELSEVKIGACAVAKIHGLVKLSLGPEPVEDDPIECDHDHFNHDLDDGADQGPRLSIPVRSQVWTLGTIMLSTHLHSADQIVIDLIFVQLLPFSLLA